MPQTVRGRRTANKKTGTKTLKEFELPGSNPQKSVVQKIFGGSTPLVLRDSVSLYRLDLLNELTRHRLAVAIQHSRLVQEEQCILDA